MVRGQIRQGDVLLIPVDEQPPKEASQKELVVLAEGEVTGHAHRLRGNLLEWEQDSIRYVRIVGSDVGTLQHEDHDPVPAAVVTPEQTYQVVRQREWDLSGQWRQVAD